MKHIASITYIYYIQNDNTNTIITTINIKRENACTITCTRVFVADWGLKGGVDPSAGCVSLCGPTLGCRWLSLACVGLRWPTLGCRWLSLACVGLCWPTLGCRWLSLACVGLRWPTLGCRWLSLACVGLCWHSLAVVSL